MADPAWIEDILKGMATIAGSVGLSGWLVKRNSAKIDDLLQGHTPRSEFNAMSQSLRDEIASAREEQVKSSAATHARLDQVLLMLAKRGDE